MNRPMEKYVEEGAYPDAHHPRTKRPAPALPSGTRPRVLLLQGPVGPFFRHLQQHLADSGFDAWRICFNAGARFFASRNKRVDFSGDIDEWEAWFTVFVASSEERSGGKEG